MFGVLNKYLMTIKEDSDSRMELGIFRKDIDPTSASIVFFGTIQSIVTLWCLSGYKLSLKKDRFYTSIWIFIKVGLRLNKYIRPAP